MGSPEPAFVTVPEILALSCCAAGLAAVDAAGAPPRPVVCCCWARTTTPARRKKPQRKSVFLVTPKDTTIDSEGYGIYKFLQGQRETEGGEVIRGTYPNYFPALRF